MTDLLRELEFASRDVRQVHLDRLRGLGVSIGWLADAPTYPFGVAHCEAIGSGLYQPGEGVLHVVIPVMEEGELVDLCAFRSTDPGNWLLRAGHGWALGLERGVGWYMWGLPVTLYSDPLDWLRGQGEGICVLDWDSPEVRQLDVLEAVTCSTPAVATLLRGALTRPPRLPKISLMEARNVA